MMPLSCLANHRVIVVVPTYNERDSLPQLVTNLLALPTDRLSVLVVDDNSPDGTGALADELSHSTAGRVQVLHRQGKEGLGRAYAAGMAEALAAGAEVVVQMDADGSHPVSAIDPMVTALAMNSAAVAVGSRYVEGGSIDELWPWHRRVLSAGANAYVRRVLDLPVHDATAGFKAWKAEALRVIDPGSVMSGGYSFQVEMAHRVTVAGLISVEVPIHFVERTEGTSKMSLGVQAESLLMPWRLRRSKWRPHFAREQLPARG
ncbi:MAG TPA: polyprenol monophosphomannose synthase [Flexivirga sp.]|uniref:polyprenol monophosphomannose synthase n=1 Tax=Flexivirga sp. TaxID=1962927 RepID=UPI002BA8E579|nr:polyprenol monophosphomannose synthase [Flexivirga sp.]HWC24604.1 polyprenol monophosphomannose synthase [Flexivirga sp.]